MSEFWLIRAKKIVLGLCVIMQLVPKIWGTRKYLSCSLTSQSPSPSVLPHWTQGFTTCMLGRDCREDASVERRDGARIDFRPGRRAYCGDIKAGSGDWRIPGHARCRLRTAQRLPADSWAWLPPCLRLAEPSARHVSGRVRVAIILSCGTRELCRSHM